MIEFTGNANVDTDSNSLRIDSVVSVSFYAEFDNVEDLAADGGISGGDYYIVGYGYYDDDDRFQLVWLRAGLFSEMNSSGDRFAGPLNNFGSLDQGEGTFWSILDDILPVSLSEDKRYNCIDALENSILFKTIELALGNISTDYYSVEDTLVDIEEMDEDEVRRIYFYASRSIWELTEAVVIDNVESLRSDIKTIEDKMDVITEELELGFVLLDD